MAVRALQRLNASPEDRDEVLMLVTEQTLLAHVSQRRDFDDPQIVQEISSVVETTDNLNMLLLHTFADLTSVDETAWSERNRFLLWSLYFRVMDRLMFGRELSGAEHARVAEIQRGVLEQLAGGTAGGLGAEPFLFPSREICPLHAPSPNRGPRSSL